MNEDSPFGNSQSQKNQERLYEEVQRQIDYQIETNRWLENQAGRLLRILIALIGILLSVAGRFVLSIFNSNSNFSLVNVDKSALELVNQFSFIGKVEASFVVAILAMCAVGFFLFSISQLFYETTKYAMRIVWSPQIDPGINIGKDTAKVAEEYYFRDIEKGLVDKYVSKIRENQRILEESQKNWQKCHDSIEKGINYFFLTLTAIIPLATFADPFLIVVNFLLIVIYIGYQFVSKISWSEIEPYLIHSRFVDTSLLLLLVFFFLTATPSNETYEGLEAIGLSIVFIGGVFLLAAVPYREPPKVVIRLLVRNGILSFVSILVLVILTAEKAGTYAEISQTHVPVRIVYAITGSTFITFLSLGILILLWGLYFSGVRFLQRIPTNRIIKISIEKTQAAQERVKSLL